MNPKTYVSPSKEYTLSVNPGDREGIGAATYRLSRKSRTVWEGKRPFTLWQAGVTDDGTVAGYAYSFGLEGGGAGPNAYGDFEIVILDSTGATRLDQKIKRTPSPYLHTNPEPVASGLIVDAANDRLIVRMADTNMFQMAETWWDYQLSTGQQRRQYVPKRFMEPDSPANSLFDVRPVAGTPLLLLHWWRLEEGTPWSRGARFTLITPQGQPVWQLDLPRDYNVPGDETAQDRLLDAIHAQGAILHTDQPGQFTVRFVAQRQQVTFAIVAQEPGKWRVSELHREPYMPARPKPTSAPAPILHLHPHDKIVLRVPGSQAPPPIRRVFDLVSAGAGRLAFLRREDHTALVVVNTRGSVLHTVSLAPIPLKDQDTLSSLHWRNGTRFLVFVERHMPQPEDDYLEAYQVEARTGVIARLPGFRCPPVEAIAGLPEEGFVVLATVSAKSTMKSEVYAYDAQGRRLWALTRDFGYRANEEPGALFSPKSLTVLHDGRVAVLDVIQHTVQMYNPHGRYLATISLDRAWGRKASYPSDILADGQGGFLVHDFDGTPALVWMNAQGSVVRSFTPRYANGTSLENPTLCLSPEGNLWATDTYSLLQINAEGHVTKRLGEAPHTDALRAIAELTVCPDGRILAADERTNAVHVFDAQGSWLHVCKPHTADQERPSLVRSISQQIELGPQSIFAIAGEWFGADGKRREKPPGFHSLSKRLQSLQRRPDGSWLQQIQTSAVAPGGALAVIDGGSLKSEGVYLSLYSATDAPVRRILLPAAVGSYPALAYDGKRAVVAGDKHLYCYATTGKLLWRCALPQEKGMDAAWTPYLIESGHILCLFDGHRTLFRYTMP